MRVSLKTVFGLISGCAVLLYLGAEQPWMRPQFRPRANRAWKQNCFQISSDIRSTAKAARAVGAYNRKQGGDWQLLAFGETKWIYEIGPENYDRTFGDYTQQSSTFHLVDRYDVKTLPEHLYPIEWSGRCYLLRPCDFPAFEQAIATGEEPRTTKEGRFFLRDGDELLTVSGQPSMTFESAGAN